MSLARGIVFALCTCALAACERTGVQGPAHGSAEIAASEAPPGVLPTSFLERIALAPAKVAYTATRSVSFEYPVGEGIATLKYTERVVSDGKGGFAIDPIAVQSPQMTTGERELFELMQKHREGFFYRYRDFHIDDLPLFTRAYRLHDTGYAPTIAGRECTELTIHRNEPAPTWHRAAIDAATGLVLRCEELDSAGRVLAQVEFQDLVLVADPSVELHVDLAASPLDLRADTTAQIGFRVLVPKAVPSGFMLRKSEKVEDENGQRWARLVYSDGAAQIFLLHTDVVLTAATSALGSSTESDLDRHSVRVLQVGPWTVAQGFLGTHRLIAMGKLDVQDLLRMLDSAL